MVLLLGLCAALAIAHGCCRAGAAHLSSRECGNVGARGLFGALRKKMSR